MKNSLNQESPRFMRPVLAFLCALVLSSGCKTSAQEIELTVTATAFNSVPSQTSGDPTLTAWGDRLKPGMRAIAVSRDLIKMGLTHKTRVKIEGLKGEYIVLDKLASRWKKRIDIYMGEDVEAAKEWGKKEVKVYWLKAN